MASLNIVLNEINWYVEKRAALQSPWKQRHISNSSYRVLQQQNGLQLGSERAFNKSCRAPQSYRGIETAKISVEPNIFHLYTVLGSKKKKEKKKQKPKRQIAFATTALFENRMEFYGNFPRKISPMNITRFQPKKWRNGEFLVAFVFISAT